MGFDSMKYFLITILLFTLSSCAKNYKSTLPDDPFFNTKESETKKLGAAAHPYPQRKGALKTKDDGYQPKPNENYYEFCNRISNTFVLQEHEQKELLAAIEKKKEAISQLDNQIGLLKSKYISLRVQYADLTLEEKSNISALSLFQRYQIRPGDTLQKIAYNNYKTHRAWLGIYRFNLERFPNGPNRLKPGEWIVIPNINYEQSLKAHQSRRK